MTLPASRRRFLQLAGAGLAVAGTGLPQLGHAQPATAAAPAPAEGAVLLNFNECPYGPSRGPPPRGARRPPPRRPP
ncbi:twin-arginine translocation signal domain-containing protein, partial [Stenotrophomonas maltophilia]|nr:twin-arginine translocation signal domain-containing protein [Stenotrophomonas maltophilia]